MVGLPCIAVAPMAFAVDNERLLATSADAAFHAARAALARQGAQVLKSNVSVGTIFAQSVSTQLTSTKVTNWNVTVENIGDRKTLVRVDRATVSPFKSALSPDEEAGWNQEFFNTVDSELAKHSVR